MKRFLTFFLCIFIALSAVTAEVTSITLSRDHLSSQESDRSIVVTVHGTGFKSLRALHVQLSLDGTNQSPVQCRINAAGTEGTATVTVPTVASVGSSGTSFIVRAIENFTSISDVTAVIKITPPATVSRITPGDFDIGDSSIDLKIMGRNLDIRGETVITVVDSDGVEARECRTVLSRPVAAAQEEPSVNTDWDIGYMILRDGTIVSPDDYNRRRMGIPIGVIAYERDGEPYMVGVQSIQNANNGNGMRWCSYNAPGYRSISELNSWCDSDYVEYGTVTGFTDGSQAWDIIQAFDSTAEDRGASYYDMFYYAECYGGDNNLFGTKYETGWFVPSLWELAEIYRNSWTINDSFSEFCNYDLGYRRYRSSSQNPNDSSYAPGINFDEGYVWRTYSSKDESDVYVMVVCPVFGSSGTGSSMIETTIPLPSDSGIYSIQVTIDGILQSAVGRIQIAGEPEITRVEMPDVSVAYCGQSIPCIIYGKNFSVAGMSADKFIIFGLEASRVQIISDSQASVTITYPATAGNYDVTFVCGESIHTDTLHILSAVTGTYAPGDIILSDGSKIDAANVGRMTEAQKASAVAVVVFTKYGLVPYGMGLHQNDSIYLMREYNTGYNAMITDIIATRSNSWYADDSVNVSGDNDGYDNWLAIQTLDPNGAKNASNEYPGFNWANTYGITFNLPASCSDGWFIPSLAELVEIYKNRTVINKSLSALGYGNLMRGWYSTSNQDPDDTDYVWRVDFSDGEIDTGYKDSSRYELVIRQFSSSSTGTGGTSLRRN